LCHTSNDKISEEDKNNEDKSVLFNTIKGGVAAQNKGIGGKLDAHSEETCKATMPIKS